MPKLELKMSSEENRPVRQMYVQKRTGFIFEAQIMDKFVLIRMATPGFEHVLHKMPVGRFVDEYEECDLNPEVIREYLRGERFDTPLTIY